MEKVMKIGIDLDGVVIDSKPTLELMKKFLII